MDEAFLTLLEKKDFAYITVKEICETAGVNRSTFYLHYETMADLLSESVSHMNEQFLAHMEKDTDAFIHWIRLKSQSVKARGKMDLRYSTSSCVSLLRS